MDLQPRDPDWCLGMWELCFPSVQLPFFLHHSKAKAKVPRMPSDTKLGLTRATSNSQGPIPVVVGLLEARSVK